MVEIAFSPKPTNLVYHVENPLRQSWHDVLGVVAATLKLQRTDLIPFHLWLKLVQDEADSADPTRSLLPFFEHEFEHMACGDVVMDTKNAREASPSLRRLGLIRPETIEKYIGYWKSIGFLK